MASEDPADRFAGTESYYADHRPGYGEDAIRYLAARYDLGARSHVLDLGCGAGQLAVPLARHAGTVVGMDPNEEMLAHARERAADAGRTNLDWRVGSDADLPAVLPDLPPLALTTMGRSFHWMDQASTLDALREHTAPGGGVALLNDPEWLCRGTEAWQAVVHDVVSEFLDDPPERTGPVSYEDDPWDEKLAAHGFEDAETREFRVDRDWTVEGVLGYVFSLSYCSPATLGDDQAAFADRVRSRLRDHGEPPFRQPARVEVIAGRTQG
jgi:SAM-dependent methyltransferase